MLDQYVQIGNCLMFRTLSVSPTSSLHLSILQTLLNVEVESAK